MGVASGIVVAAGRGDDFLEVGVLQIIGHDAVDHLLDVRHQAGGANEDAAAVRIARGVLPAIVELGTGARTRERRLVDPLIVHVGGRLVLNPRRTGHSPDRRGRVLARRDVVGLILRDLLAARRRRIVDVPGRLSLELVDDLNHAVGTDAGVDRVGDELDPGRVVHRDRAGAAVDDDVALHGSVGRRRDDLAVQIDVAARPLHHAAQDDLVGGGVVLGADLHVGIVHFRQILRQVDIAAVLRVGLGLREGRRIALEVVDGLQRVVADVDGVVAARSALDRAVDVQHRCRQDDGLADDEGGVVGRTLCRVRSLRRDHLILDVDDLEVGRAARAIERAPVGVDALAVESARFPGRGGDGLGRRALDGRKRGRVRYAAGVGIAVAGRPLPHRQEDRRIKRSSVEEQIQQACGEDRIRRWSAGAGAAIRGVRMQVAGAVDIDAGIPVAVCTEIGRCRHHRRQGIVVGRLVLGVGPLRGHVVVGAEDAADTAVEGERAVRHHHLDRRGIERLRRHDVAEVVGDLEQTVLVGDDTVEIDVGRAGQRLAVIDGQTGRRIPRVVSRRDVDQRRRAVVGREGHVGRGAGGDVRVRDQSAGHIGDRQVRQGDEVEALVLDLDQRRGARDHGRRRIAGATRPGQGLRNDRDVAARHQDVTEREGVAGRVGGEGRLLDQRVNLALDVAGRVGAGERDLGMRRSQRGLDLRRRQSAQRGDLGHDRLVGIEAADDGVLDLLVVPALHRTEVIDVGHVFQRQRIVGARRRQRRRTRAERDGDQLVVVDAGHHQAVERDRAGSTVIDMAVVIAVLLAEHLQIGIVVAAETGCGDQARGGREVDVADAEHLRTDSERQAGVVVGIGRAAVEARDRNDRVVVDDRRRGRGNAAVDAAVAGKAGCDVDLAPGLHRRAAADIDVLDRVSPGVGAGADAADRAVDVGVGIVARRHPRGGADIDVAGAEQLPRLDVDRERGVRGHVRFGAAAGEEAGRGDARGVVRVQRVVGLDVDRGRRRARIGVEAQDGPGVDVRVDGLGDGRVAERRSTREHAARARTRAAAGLVDDVVGDDVHVAAGRVDDEMCADLGGGGRGHVVGRAAAGDAGRRGLIGIAAG